MLINDCKPTYQNELNLAACRGDNPWYSLNKDVRKHEFIPVSFGLVDDENFTVCDKWGDDDKVGGFCYYGDGHNYCYSGKTKVTCKQLECQFEEDCFLTYTGVSGPVGNTTYTG